ncbi:MAG: hypothetical protein GY772_29615 [bacterium]|nr:hypothetical protein [bacterium]
MVEIRRIVIHGIVVEATADGYVAWCDVTGEVFAEGTRQECLQVAQRVSQWAVGPWAGRLRRGA